MRIDRDQAVRWLTEVPIHKLGAQAQQEKKSRFGDRVFWIRNFHLNYTNVCRGECKVCHYAKKPGQPGGYVYSIDEILRHVGRAVQGGATEVHVVGGINPQIEAEYYFELVREIRNDFPDLYIKAFTAVEIDHIAEISETAPKAVLEKFIGAGLNGLTGGGAEIFNARVREELFPGKISADRWLEIHRSAHELGIKTTATMLFGHQETAADRVDHLLRIRQLQDRTDGFGAFVPLPVVGFAGAEHLDGIDALRTLAVSRMVLDNVDHIKVFWPIWGVKLAQLALSYGADDLDGTVGEYKIVDQQGLSVEAMVTLIRQAGCEPIERDSLYRAR